MKVLLSIKPEFANQIFEGSKRFEYRRVIFKNPNIKKIIVYASSPIQKVIGEFDIDHLHNEEIDYLWEKTKKYSGISEEHYRTYFNGKEKGFAIGVKNPKRYSEPKSLSKTYGIKPPQSFQYIG